MNKGKKSKNLMDAVIKDDNEDDNGDEGCLICFK